MGSASSYAARVFLALTTVIAVVVFVQMAGAATPNGVQYNTTTTSTTQTGQVAGTTQKPAKIHAAKSGGTLPFTGFDLGIAAAGAALFLVGGVALRRVGRNRRSNA